MRHIKDKHKCLNFSTFYSRAEAEAGLWFMGALAEEEKYYWEERLKEFDFRKIAESDEFRCMVEGTAPPPSPLQLRRASRARRSSRRNSVSKTRRKSRLSVAFANDPPYDPFHLQTDSTYSASPSLPFCESFPVDLDLSASVVNDLLSFGNLAEPLYPFDTTTSLSTPGSSDPFANIDFDGWSWPVLPV